MNWDWFKLHPTYATKPIIQWPFLLRLITVRIPIPLSYCWNILYYLRYCRYVNNHHYYNYLIPSLYSVVQLIAIIGNTRFCWYIHMVLFIGTLNMLYLIQGCLFYVFLIILIFMFPCYIYSACRECFGKCDVISCTNIDKKVSEWPVINWHMYIYFLSRDNIWNFNCARATAFIFDTRTGVLVKVSKFLKQKMSRPERDSNTQPSDSCRIL